MYLTSVIDVALWNKAAWHGTVWGYCPDADCPASMGLLFADPEAGAEIFQRWRKQLGDSDVHELIRVSVIEGDIPGEDPGYTVYIGTDAEAAVSLAEMRGQKITGGEIMTTARFNRMNPGPGSQNLPMFKSLLSKHRHYLLLPVTKDEDGLCPLFDLAIEKKGISFLRAEALEDNDPEVVVLKKADHAVTQVPRDGSADAFGPENLTGAIAVLEEELAAGRVKRPVDPMIVDSLASVEHDGAGQVVPESVNPMLGALALSVANDALERDALKIPLQHMQARYVAILEGCFGDFFSLMNERDLTPHQFARYMAKTPSIVSAIERDAPALQKELRDFWAGAGLVTMAHLRQMSTLKAVYGGNAFPHPASDLVSNVGLYADTLVLPDPLLTGTALQNLAQAPEMVYILAKNALTAMGYRELALADLATPLVVFAPSYFYLSRNLPHIVADLSESDLRMHMERVFAREFADIKEILEFLRAMPDAETLAGKVADIDRFTFDVEESPLPLDQINTLSRDILSRLDADAGLGDFRNDIFTSFYGRFMQANSALAHCDLYGGVPLIDAPTSWQYLVWKYEYAAAQTGTQDDHRDAVVQHVLHTELRDIPVLRNVPPNAVIELRRREILSDLRDLFRAGLGEITTADEASMERVARQVAENMGKALDEHRAAIESLTREGHAFLGSASLTTAGVALGIVAAAVGGVRLGIAAAIAGCSGLGAIKDVVARGRELYRKHRQLRQSPVGMLWRVKR